MPVSWFTCAPAAMNALVVRMNTSTIGDTATDASPVPAPPATATEETLGSPPIFGICTTSGDIEESAVTAIASVASRYVVSAAATSDSTTASVVIVSTFTAMAAPTAVPPSARPPASAKFWSPNGAVAVTVMPSVERTCVPFPILARVS